MDEVAWSLDGLTDENQDVARRNMKSRDKALLPFPTEFTIALSPSTPRDDIVAVVQKDLSALAVQWIYDAATSTGLCFATGNVWSRSARRKRRKPDHADAGSVEIESSDKKLKTDEHVGTNVQVPAPAPASTSTLVSNTNPEQRPPDGPDAGSRGSAGDAAKDDDNAGVRISARLGVRITVEVECVRIDWLKGQDSVLWESFCGMLKRAIDTAVGSGGGDGDTTMEGKTRGGDCEHS